MNPDSAVYVAGIAAAVSILSIVITAGAQIWTVRQLEASNRAAADAKAETDAQLAALSSRLATGRDAAAARTAYEFDARQRLYQEVNPLLFQLREQCAGSVRRVRRIVRGDIKVNSIRHVLTTTQRLIAPLVYVQEIQRRMTAVDLRLDDDLKAQYTVAREMLWVLHEGTYIASAEPPLDYRRDPRSEQDPRQHLTFAQLQRIVASMTGEDADGRRRPLPIMELEDRQAEPAIAATIERMTTLFRDSSAETTPALWRLLLAYAFLMEILIGLVDHDASEVVRIVPWNIGEYASPDSPDAIAGEAAAVATYLRQKLAQDGLRVPESAGP